LQQSQIFCNGTLVGVKMPRNPNEIKLVNNTMANVTRRKIMSFLSSGSKSIEEIGGEIGRTMFDFHLKLLQQANLIEIEEGTVKLSEYGKNFLKDKEEKSGDKTADLSQVKPVKIAEVRQLFHCIADSSKLRVIANMAPPLGRNLRLLEPFFPRGRYSDKINALVSQKGDVITTIYGTGKVTLTMIKNEDEAKEALDNLKSTINEAIAKGVSHASRENVRVEPMEINKSLPKTNGDKFELKIGVKNMDVKEINSYGQELIEYLKLTTSPVAIKLISKGGEIPAGIKKVDIGMTHCQFVDRVRRTREEFYTLGKDQMCKIGAGTMGINEIPKEVFSGESYYKELKLFSTQGAARRTVEKIPILPPDSVESVMYSPLEEVSFVPDVVVFICNPKQVMLLTQASIYKTGGRLEVSFAGTQSLCSESVVQIYKEGKVGVAVGCIGSRGNTEIEDEEMLIGIPIEQLGDVLSGLKEIWPK